MVKKGRRKMSTGRKMGPHSIISLRSIQGNQEIRKEIKIKGWYIVVVFFL